MMILAMSDKIMGIIIQEEEQHKKETDDNLVTIMIIMTRITHAEGDDA